MIPFSVKTVVNTVSWGWLQTFQSSSSTSCHLSKGHIWLACKHLVSKFHSCFERQNRNNISLKFWQSLIQKKKEKRKGGQSHDHLLQNDMLSSLLHPPLVCHCIYPSFLLPSFLLLAGKDRRHETFPHFFPFFFKLDKSCEDMSERGGVPFFFNRTTNKI